MFYYVRHTLKTSRNYAYILWSYLSFIDKTKGNVLSKYCLVNRKIESNIIYNSSRNSTYEFE